MDLQRRAILAGMAAMATMPARGSAQTIAEAIEVRAAPGATQGTLRFGGRAYRCALGRSGIVTDKREGDGGTPAGRFFLRRVLYRPDRVLPPFTDLASAALHEDDGWCDDPADPKYNQAVRLPYAASHEEMWRTDHLYDLLAVIGWNDQPAKPGAGSAIFLHVAAPGLAPTAGCVALPLADLQGVLTFADPTTPIDIALA